MKENQMKQTADYDIIGDKKVTAICQVGNRLNLTMMVDGSTESHPYIDKTEAIEAVYVLANKATSFPFNGSDAGVTMAFADDSSMQVYCDETPDNDNLRTYCLKLEADSALDQTDGMKYFTAVGAFKLLASRDRRIKDLDGRVRDLNQRIYTLEAGIKALRKASGGFDECPVGADPNVTPPL